MFKLKPRHWALLAMAVSVVCIKMIPEPMDAVRVGIVAGLFWAMADECDD